MHDLFEEGYIVFPRSVDPAIFNNEKWFKVWWWCLMEANFQDNIVPVNTGRGTTSMMVKRGQFVFGRNKHSKTLNMAPSTLWKIILGFEKRQILNIESNNHNSLITFCNYNEIVDSKNYEGTAKGTGKEQASDRQVTGKEHNRSNEKKESNEKNGIKKKDSSKAVTKEKQILVTEDKQKFIDNLPEAITSKYPMDFILSTIDTFEHYCLNTTNGRKYTHHYKALATFLKKDFSPNKPTFQKPEPARTLRQMMEDERQKPTMKQVN